MNNSSLEKMQKQQVMSLNAIDCMVKKLIELKDKKLNNDQLMNLCVWPILRNCAEKIEKIELGEIVTLDDFEQLLNKKDI